MPRFILKCDTCENDCDIYYRESLCQTRCSYCLSYEIDRSCAECDNIIYFSTGRLNSKKKYCSKECNYKAYCKRQTNRNIIERKKIKERKEKELKLLGYKCIVCGKYKTRQQYLKLKKRCKDCDVFLKNMVK